MRPMACPGHYAAVTLCVEPCPRPAPGVLLNATQAGNAQLAEVVVPRPRFARILERSARLCPACGSG